MIIEGPVLVTGGAGFIGSELVHQLAAAGNDVIAVDNLVNGKAENLDGVTGGRVRLETVDIRDTEKMAPLVAAARTIFHLACLGVRHSIHAPVENHRVNAEATLELLMMARCHGVGRFVQVSTSEVYGTCRFTPMTEDHPTLAKTIYGGSKLAGESYARAFWETYGYPTTVVRPFNAYGPRSHHEGDSGEVIPKFMLRAMAGQPLIIFGAGTQTRDFTFVADTARAIILAGICEAAIGKTINVGQGAEICINELADEVAACVGTDISVVHDKPRPGDVLRLIADSTKAEQLLGYRPGISLSEGLAHLHNWYGASGRRPDDLLSEEIVHGWQANETTTQPGR